MTDLMNAKIRRDNRDSTEDHVLALEDVIEDMQAVIIQLMHRIESLEKKTAGLDTLGGGGMRSTKYWVDG